MSFQTISDTIDQALASAGLKPDPDRVKGIAQTIRRAFAKAGISRQPPPTYAPDAPKARRPPVPRPGNGTFLKRSFSNAAGTRAYRLYVPAGHAAAPRPLILMLHGCKQNPDDFALGTRMNELADEHGFLVAYPAQAANANGANCWNWFRPGDQARDTGEPAILAGIVDAIAAEHRVDRRRVFVAGLSAGAAMAVILGETYPEVFAAVGAHSGLPYRAARDVASAFAAMQRGGTGLATDAPAAGAPTIVFHGDSDATVALSNGDAIVARALGAATQDLLRTQRIEPASATSRGYTSIAYLTPDGRPRVEQWTLHGAAHAWSGGHPQGSYTEAQGPDASAQMVRFFLAQ